MLYFIVIVLLFIQFYENKKLREELNELRNKFNILSVRVDEEELSYLHLKEEFKDAIVDMELNGMKTEALTLLINKTNMTMEEAKEYIPILVEKTLKERGDLTETEEIEAEDARTIDNTK